MRVLHVAPHPDDELLGAPATLMALRDAGHTILNLACSLGRPEQQERRRAELIEACERAGFALRIPDPPVAMSSGADLAAAEARVAGLVTEALEDGADLVVAPSPHDGHPGPELVGRAVLGVVAARGGPRVWLWGLWADLPLPSLITTFGRDRLREIGAALEAHRGELARNDYRAVLAGRARANRALGPERVFGFGSAGLRSGYAELLTQVIRRDGGWWLAAPARVPPDDPLAVGPRRDVSWWVDAPAR